MTSIQSVRRREFLAAGAVAAAAPYIASRTAFAAPDKPGANDRLTLGFIGMGKQSRGHLQWALTISRRRSSQCSVSNYR